MKSKYQIEYEQSTDCFWAKEPAKYVKLFVEKYEADLNGFNIIDIGTGEGKNAVFLANKGATMTAVDISPIALSRFNRQPDYDLAKHNINVICEDIRNINYDPNTFDIVVAYGILHCLSSTKEVKEYIDRIKLWVKPKGYFICVTFTNEIPPPDLQSYLEYESFLGKGELEQLLNDWDILEIENDIIYETHPTSMVEHEHSLVRVITRKYE